MDELNALFDKLREDDANYNELLEKIMTKVNDFDTPYAPAKNDFPKPKPL